MLEATYCNSCGICRSYYLFVQLYFHNHLVAYRLRFCCKLELVIIWKFVDAPLSGNISYKHVRNYVSRSSSEVAIVNTVTMQLVIVPYVILCNYFPIYTLLYCLALYVSCVLMQFVCTWLRNKIITQVLYPVLVSYIV